MTPETRKVLNELRNAGFDIRSLETQALDPAKDNKIRGMLLSQEAFGTYQSNKDKEIATYKTQLAQLQSVRNTLSSGAINENSEIVRTLLEKQALLEKNLIDNGFDPADIQEFMGADIQTLKNAVNKVEDVVDSNNNEDNINGNTILNESDEDDMSKIDMSKYVDTDTMKSTMANVVMGTNAITAKVNRYVREAEKLGIEVDGQKFEEFQLTLVSNLDKGIQPEQTAETFFELTKVRAEQETANQTKLINEAKAAGRAEAMKEFGVPNQRNFKTKNQHLLLNRNRKLPNPATAGQDDAESDKEITTNKFGDPEVFKNSRQRADAQMNRVTGAAEKFNSVTNRYDELGLGELGFDE